MKKIKVLMLIMCSLLSIDTWSATSTEVADLRPQTNVLQPSSMQPIVDIPNAPKINAKAYVLMDASSGYVIASSHKDQRFPPASLTKMMTSYLVSERVANGDLKLSEQVGVSRNAAAGSFPGSSRAWLRAGQKVSVDDLQRGLVIASGNDAAVALAEHVASSVDNFVNLMNQKADSLGMLNTHFKNPHGLPAEGHYSSAYDMAILARAIVWDYPEDYFLYREKNFSFNGVTQSNRNTLLWENPFVDGIKTGYTDQAGYCMAASAQKNDMRLISVVFGTKSEKARAWESQKLLSYGFMYYRTHLIFKADDIIEEQRIWAGSKRYLELGVNKDIFITVPKGRGNDLKSEVIVSNDLKAPIDLDQEVGTLKVTLDGKLLLEEPLLAMEDIPLANIFSRLWDNWVHFFVKLMN